MQTVQITSHKTVTIPHGAPQKQATPKIALVMALLATVRFVANLCGKVEETCKKSALAYVGNAPGAIKHNNTLLGEVSEGKQRRIDAELLRANYPEIAEICTKEVLFLKVVSHAQKFALASEISEQIEALTESAGL